MFLSSPCLPVSTSRRSKHGIGNGLNSNKRSLEGYNRWKNKNKLFYDSKLRTGQKQTVCEAIGIMYSTNSPLWRGRNKFSSGGIKSSKLGRTYAGGIGT